MMEYALGSFSKDEALAQLARDYVNEVGTERAQARADECQRYADQQRALQCFTYADSFARHAQALRDAIGIVREVKAEQSAAA